MSKFSKKVLSATLTATTAVWASGVMLIAPVAVQAQTTADIQAQIAALLAQIQQLQAQLSGQQGGGTSTTFTRDLTVGSRGTDVSSLQQVLISGGYLTAVSAPTGYFGSATRAALVKWQQAKGVSPAAGYFGPISRVKLGGVGGGTGGGVVVAPASGLSVALSAANPAAGSLISSSGGAAARVPVLAVDVTAGVSSGVTVSDIKFTKTGVLSDSSISGAYLVESGKVLAQYTSVSQGVVSFTGLGLNIAAGQRRTLTLAIDPASGLSAGNTVGFALASADNISSVDANNAVIAETGLFPIQGNTFTVTNVSNPSIATLTVASSSIGSTVDAGTTNNLVGSWNFTVGNSKVYLRGISFKVVGSANKTDIRNVKLSINGSQVVPTLVSVPADGNAYFDLTSSQVSLNTGTNSVQVNADVMGSPFFTFQFEVLNSYDIYAVDSQYNVPISGQSNIGTQVSINAGRITVSTAGDTPTGNVAKGQSSVTLAKFTVYAAGEAVKVKWLDYSLTFSGTASSTFDVQLKNVSLVDDAGGQVGSTLSSLTAAGAGTCSSENPFSAATSSAASNCFGNSTSPVNYVIPANTTRVFSLKGDIQSGATFTTVTARLLQSTSNNLQGLTSSQSANSGGATGSALTLASSALTVAKNTAVGTQTITAPASGVKIGSYALSASSAEGVTVNNLTITTGAAGASFQNLKVKIGSTQFGQTYGVLAASTAYSFSGTQFTVPAGGTTYVDVWSDVLSSATAGTKATITTLSGCAANGQISLSAITCTSTAGQDVLVAGQATVTVTADSGQAPASQYVMGSTGNPLATFRFTETSNIENVKITDLNVFDQVAATNTVKSAFSNLSLYNGATLVGTAGAAVTAASTSNPGPGYIYSFHFGTPVLVPQANSLTLVLKGDVASYASSGASDNTTHIFKIATSTDTINDTAPETVVALGNTSNATSAVTMTSASGNTQTVQRSKLTFSSAPLGTTSGRARSTSDDLATVTFTADAAGAVSINTVTITFGGSMPSNAAFMAGVSLLDENGNSLGTGNTSTTCNGTNTCVKNFILGATTAGQVVNQGSSRTWKVRADTTAASAIAAAANVSQSISVTVNAATSVAYTDALDTSAQSNINLQTGGTTYPVTIQSASYPVGG